MRCYLERQSVKMQKAYGVKCKNSDSLGQYANVCQSPRDLDREAKIKKMTSVTLKILKGPTRPWTMMRMRMK